MKMAILYISTLVIFLAVDVVGIKTIIRPIFERHVGDLMADPLRLGPAAAFYAFYVVGLLYFVSVPALRADAPIQAALAGAFLGLLCYGTYEFTSLAILRDWSWQQVIADTSWGAALTGFSAWAGVTIARMVG
ncbi:DUF2177 family protein [Paracoccus stylophorae]|uniref:DUF2177 family protein n=1 Tax=Paracoccus stylophorae TaxID=659350 RepID=A0ABY7SW07_9RHOB|nr:DUF2177 family protein [Paracoccus stylophorae]WCR10658.1 DUF2177 family protein [Paracoccus stylophorae]